MDPLREQISTLTLRVDSLCQLVEQLSERTSDIFQYMATDHPTQKVEKPSYSHYQGHSSRSGTEISLEHKDVLMDSDYSTSDQQMGDRTLSPEVQIQRLTAQLTAAYNRIAALEEQLLAQRIHS
jgi:chaperonin cofactor prefoldin